MPLAKHNPFEQIRGERWPQVIRALREWGPQSRVEL